MSARAGAGPRSVSHRPAVLGRYRLLKKIGMGGMAEIWVASVAGISGVQKICVVKQILPNLADSPEFVRMFLDEARIAATLDHPNLVQMYDVEEVDGVPLIAMEYLHGEDLRVIKRALKTANRRMALEQAVTIAVGMTAGLHYAHEKVGFDGKLLNIVHRDVSPHNVFVTYDGAVKILDFGIAKARNRVNETRDGALKGKVPYMSPEQCKSEPLDRRSDIYSVGILLYELSTGHKMFRRGATEFELMRAIVEDAVVPPSQLILDYPPELERIVLKCLSRDRQARYATGRELQIELEAFAREARIATSALALSSFMAELFGQRVEAWRDALASGSDDILSQIVARPAAELEDDSGVSDTDDPAGSPGGRTLPAEQGTKRSAPLFYEDSPPSSETAPLSARGSSRERPGSEPRNGDRVAPRALTVIRRRLGGLQVLSLSGRMTEEFRGLGLARDLTERVLFDLAGVQRVTSFGVREWLTLLTEASRNVADLYLGRCSEPIVNQMSMIRRFVGEGRITSFYGPYRCGHCGETFQRLFDCERDAEVLRTQEPPESPCGRCGASATFDDDAESYFAFAASHAGVQLPPDVRRALDELAKLDTTGAREAIEKTVDERETTVRVRAQLDANLRWKRAFDGIDGALVLDFAGGIGVAPEGALALELALRSLGDEVRSIRIEGCPPALLGHLAAAKPALRAVVATALVDGRCERCDGLRPTLIDVRAAVAAALEGREPYMPCKRCNAPLSFPSLRPTLLQLGGASNLPASPSAPVRTVAPQPEPASEAPALEAPAPIPPGPRRARRIAAMLLGGTVVAILGLASYRGVGGLAPVPGNDAAPRAQAARAGAVSAMDAPPSWAIPLFASELDQVFVVGQGSGATKEAALAAARCDAISRLASSMLPSLAGSPISAFMQAQGGGERRPEASPDEASRYLRQVGTFATPERVDAAFRDRDGGVFALARYRMRRQDYDAAVQSYRKAVSVLGLTAATLFPLLDSALRASTDVFVVAVDEAGPAARAGVRAGDGVVAVNGRPVLTLEALQRALEGLMRSSTVVLELEAAGERRTATLDLKGHQ